MGRQATFQNFPMRVRGFVDGRMDGWGGTAGVRSLCSRVEETLVTHVEWKQEGEEGNQAGD